jgi:hypothetical protein
MKRVLSIVAVWGVGALAAGCCSESKRRVGVAGTASYDGFQAGEIRLMLAESQSSRCSGSWLGGGHIQFPGVQIAEATLSQPGPFALEGDVCWTDSPPMLDLLAWYLEGQPVSCKAGVLVSIAPKTAPDVSLALKEGPCPLRK